MKCQLKIHGHCYVSESIIDTVIRQMYENNLITCIRRVTFYWHTEILTANLDLTCLTG